MELRVKWRRETSDSSPKLGGGGNRPLLCCPCAEGPTCLCHTQAHLGMGHMFSSSASSTWLS